MSEWRDIDTAPQDQRSILGCHTNSGLMRVCHRFTAGDDKYEVEGCSNAGRYWRPTHWQPLPKPPEAK